MVEKNRSGRTSGEREVRRPLRPPARREEREPRRGRDDRDDQREPRRESQRDDRRDDRRESRRDRPTATNTRREYWQPTADSARKQRERSRSSFETPIKGTMFKAKTGDNCVRILPPTWADPEHYCLSVWEHRYVGPDESHYLCLRKMKNEPCAVCDAERDAKDHGDDEDAKKLKPMQRWVCYALHRDNEDKNLRKTPMIWDMNKFQDEEIVDRTYDKKSNAAIDVTNPDTGYDLTFRRTGAGDKTRYGGFDFDRDPSPIADDPDDMAEILDFIEKNPITDMLNFRDNEFLEKMLYGTAEATDENLDDNPEDDPDAPYDDSLDDDPENNPEDDPDALADDDNPEDNSDAEPSDDNPEPEVRPARRALTGRDRNGKAPGRAERAPEREERRPSRPAPRPAQRQQPRRPAPAGRKYRD